MENNINWELKPINELCILAIDCVNKTAPVVEYETPYKMIRTTNVKNGYIDLDTVRYVEKEVYNKWTRRSTPQYGDVILTREAPVGGVGRFISKDDKVFLGQRLFHYRPDPELLDWNYLAYLLQSETMQGKLNGMSFGATVSHITVEDAETLKIPCPDINIQRKIGIILSNYDNLIENNNKRIKLLENMAEELYKEWFVRLRFPDYENTKIVDGVPDGWEYNPVNNFVEVADNRGKTPPTVEEETDYPLIEVNALGKNSRIVNYNLIKKYVDTDTYNKWFRNKPIKYDTLIATVGSIAEMSMFVIEKGQIAQNIVAINAISISKFYLYQSLKYKKEELLLLNIGGTQPSIKVPHILGIKLLIPNIIIQEKFDNILMPLVNKIALLDIKNQNLKKTRDLLLPRLISGKLNIADLEIK